ncbi:hypothetical protein OCZ42_004605, partial [Salmonella enterica]|nr:hypothetical protein [Salmonella enterica]
MEVNKISQIIALCDSIPVMLDTKILDAESAIKTLALIRQLAEEAHKTYRYANRKDQDYRLSNIDNPIFDKFDPKVIAEWVLSGDVKCLMKGLKQIKKSVYVTEVDPNEPEKDDMICFDENGVLTPESQKKADKIAKDFWDK